MTDDSNGPGGADVLLVEDNPADVRLVRAAFEEEPYCNDLHVVSDGAEAIEFCEQRGEYRNAPRPDVVLLDLNLPRVDGHDVLAELRSDSGFVDVPIVVFSSSDARSDVARSYELGANAYLTKPIDPDEYVEAVRNCEQFWTETARVPDYEG